MPGWVVPRSACGYARPAFAAAKWLKRRNKLPPRTERPPRKPAEDFLVSDSAIVGALCVFGSKFSTALLTIARRKSESHAEGLFRPECHPRRRRELGGCATGVFRQPACPQPPLPIP